MKPLLLVAFAFSLIFPSIELVDKYWGLTGLIFYIGLVLTASFVFFYRFWPYYLKTISERRSLFCFILCLAVLFILFIRLYPQANSGLLGGGSDRDDSLRVSALRLLEHESPYTVPTYLGNPVHHLPGSFLLAIPFVVMGNPGYQNFFWLTVFFFTLGEFLKNIRVSFLLCWFLIIFCPEILREIATGGDYFTNALYVSVFIMWVLIFSEDPARRLLKWLSCILLGVGLASRMNYLLLLPLFFMLLKSKHGIKNALTSCLVILTGFFAVTAPFYFHSPDVVKIWATQNYLVTVGGIIKSNPTLLLSLTVSFSLLCAVIPIRSGARSFFFRSFLIQLMPVLLLTLIRLFSGREPRWMYNGFGLNQVVFFCIFFFMTLMAETNER